MDLHYKQEVSVGALVLAAVVVFVLGTMWLGGKSFRAGASLLEVEFADVGNLKKGNPVKVSGVTLGSVEDIRFEDVGKVVVGLSLDPRITPKQDARVEIAAIGLVGDLVINLDPGQAAEPLPAGQRIVGRQEQGIMTMGTELGEQAKTTMAALQDLASQRLADDLHATLTSVQRLADTYSNTRQGPSAELTQALDTFQRLGTRLDSTLNNPDINRTLAQTESLTVRFTELAERLVGTSARLDSIMSKVNAGQGTAGMVVNDSTLYVNLRDLSASLKAFVDDLKKNPGKISVQVKLF
ncbi:MAG: MlaD family protein [Gemmatimonadota bacterium]|jgi:phospholipid/cholesterol/gamma-HCH transport system substrate-binding protein|nr:MlaD family protein [Gemmatimonadota bacterium]